MRAGEMATEAGGTHPTGMHSCLLIPLHNLMSNLICTGAILMNATKNFTLLHNDYFREITSLSSNGASQLRRRKRL